MLLVVFSAPVFSDVTSITAPAVSVPPNGSAMVTIRWRVTRLENPNPVPPVLVSSSSAVLEVGGIPIATVGGFISVSSSLPIGTAGVVLLNEKINLSAALTRRIANSPAGSVRIVRSFTDTQKGTSGSVQVASGSASSGPLSIRRIELSFENRARTDVVYKNDNMRATVDITFRSSGILKGEWRLIDPTASLGGQGGRVLHIVRKNLFSSGEGRTRILSPPLPTNVSGLYFLAFYADFPDSNFDIPVLRYFVLENKGILPLEEIKTMDAISPINRAQLTKDTSFKWQKIEGATAYQIEVFNKGDDVPISGKLVPSSLLNLSLSSFSLDQLVPGYKYHWQVRAFNQHGQVIAKSEPRLILISQ